MSDENHQARSIDQTVLDTLWDFQDPRSSAERFVAAADDPEYTEEARAELATQLARALGIAGDTADADAVLDAIESPSDVVAARIALERGRLRSSQGDNEAAVPLFTKATRLAASGGVSFLVLDALHMLAITDAGHEEEWAENGFAVLEQTRQDRTRRWGVALHNNLGWFLHDSGRAEEALPQFELALEFARAHGTSDQRFIGQWAIARCLRSLGRLDEAREIQTALAAKRPNDEFVVSELAALAALADSGVGSAQ